MCELNLWFAFAKGSFLTRLFVKLCCHHKGVIKYIFLVIGFQDYYELLNLAVLGCASLEAAVVIPVLAQHRRCLLPFYWTFTSGGIFHEAISPNKTRQLSVAARPTYHPARPAHVLALRQHRERREGPRPANTVTHIKASWASSCAVKMGEMKKGRMWSTSWILFRTVMPSFPRS